MHGKLPVFCRIFRRKMSRKLILRLLLTCFLIAGLEKNSFSQTSADSSFVTVADSSVIRPDVYAYVEGFGPARFFSINGEKLLVPLRKKNRVLYGRLGASWLPDLSARYTMYLLGGLNLESGEKNWSRDFGIGMTNWIDHYNWKKKGELSSHVAPPDRDPTYRYGMYLSLGIRYRFDNEMFAGFEFTPMAMSSNDGPQLILYLGVSAGFQLYPNR